MKTITRAAICEAIAQETGLSRHFSDQLSQSILNHIVSALETEGVVKISGFGKFTVLRKSPRLGRNPLTGQPLVIGPKRSIRFSPSRSMLDRVEHAHRCRRRKAPTETIDET